MSNENRYLVIKKDGNVVKYLRHEGHNHYWTLIRNDAMEYTKVEVAQALAEKNGGIISNA